MPTRLLCLLCCLLLLAACGQTQAVITPSGGEAAAPPSSQPSGAGQTDGAASQQPDGQENEPQPPADPSARYWIYVGDKAHYLDANGSPIPQEEVFTVLYDGDTGEALYRVITRTEDTGEDDEYGNPVTQSYSALYAADGTLLYDFEPVEYQTAFSRYLIRRDPRNWWTAPDELEHCRAELWDPATGETLIDGVDSVEPLGDGSYLAMGPTGLALGVLGPDGEILSGFPAPEDYYYPSCGHGLIQVLAGYDPYGASKEEQYRLLDRDFNILLEKEQINLNYVQIRGDFFLCRDGGSSEILSLPDLAVRFSLPEADGDIRYYDGERMILQSGQRPNWQYSLCDGQGNPLAGPFDRLFSDDEYSYSLVSKEPASCFLAQQGDTALLLSRDGEILASYSCEGMESVSSLTSGYYLCNIQIPADNPEKGVFHSCALLGSDFSEIIPPGKYEMIQPLTRRSGKRYLPTTLFVGGRTLQNDIWRQDLFDAAGRVVWDNLTNVGDAGEHCVAIQRGAWYGLADFEGNWITRHSIYQDFVND